jgi:large subunit ribosomal protein L16
LQYGSYGLRILKSTRLFWKQIEAARQKISRRLKKKSKVWIRVFPQVPVTQKPKEVRMGKGKGAVDHYVVRAEAGRVIFELANVNEILARTVLLKASKKLPVPSVFIKRLGFVTTRQVK